MPKKKKNELEHDVKKLRVSLEKAESRAESWKKKAEQHESTASEAKVEVAELEKKLKKAAKPAKPAAKKAPVATPVSVRRAPAKTAAPASPSPDASWTVTRLRAAARAKGVVGYSRKSKDQLLAALR